MSSSQSSAAVVDDETASGISTIPGVEGEIVPIPEQADVGVGVSPRVVVPEGEVQAG